ncbi:type VI secretion system baseplate subunit TssK [Roseateles amylovorans]|uniref:Type VI secretion system baseplate subunit TssK n=1 Tax=Roseateles amylovorans TaxID=2978473 RepID=A0ABY6AWK2_9BURK|nr:type VI secretion system baseplate subunit TssK [Roseateles amylovorans]UXH76144.1 type VI secretion system baseplate subunit TssK [Roseateles amylovorans]
MTWHHKVIWSEGMFLQPQHFQQHDRHQAAQQLARLTAVTPHARGWLSLALDRGALALGRIALQSARGLLPDGLSIDLPGDDASPAALEVPADARDELVVLAVSLPRPGLAETDAEGTPGAMAPRYRVHEADVPDDNAHAPRAARLQLGRPHLRLMLARDCVEGQAVLGVCRIAERRADHQVMLDAGYVPPTLDALRNDLLLRWMREVHGLLKQRGDTLAARLTEPGRAGVGEIADYLMLGAINRHEPSWGHRLTGGLLHPREVHAAMVALAGDLAIFGDARRPAPLPAYDHDALGLCFPPLMDMLRQGLSIVLEQGAIPITLQERKHGVRVALVPDVELQRQAQFVLAASARMPADALRTRLPAQAKIGTVEHIRDLVNLQLPGVALRPLPVAPRQIPFHAGFHYFELDTRDSDQWRQLAQSGGLALHIGGEFPGLELELWAVRA